MSNFEEGSPIDLRSSLHWSQLNLPYKKSYFLQKFLGTRISKIIWKAEEVFCEKQVMIIQNVTLNAHLGVMLCWKGRRAGGARRRYPFPLRDDAMHNVLFRIQNHRIVSARKSQKLSKVKVL